MLRNALLASALLLTVAGPALAQAPTAGLPSPATAAGQRLQLAPMSGHVVRQVMISQGGGGIEVIYDMPPGQTQSRRVVRLENVNGMLEVIYGDATGNMPTATGGEPRLVPQGGGMYQVEYGAAR